MVRTAVLSLVAVVAFAGAALADVVKLKSGETLVGTVQKQSDPGLVVLDHPVLGPLRIPMSEVEDVTLVVDTLPPDAQIEQAKLAEVRKQVRDEMKEEVRKEVEVEVAEAKAAAEAAAKAEEEKKRYANLPPELQAFFHVMHEWNVQLEMGFAGSQGNSPSLSFRIAGKAMHETETDRWTFSASYYHLQSNGETTEDNANLTALKDWLFKDSPWLFWAKGFYDYNNFQDWRNRVGGFAGVGYAIFKQDDLSLIGRFGGGYTYNFSGDQRSQPELYFGLDLIKWEFLPGNTLTGSVAWIPNLADLPQSRTDAKLEYTFKIPNVQGLSFKLGMANEYQSQTSDGSKHNDFKWYSTLLYAF